MCRKGGRGAGKGSYDRARTVNDRVDRLETWFVMGLCAVIGAQAAVISGLLAALVALLIVRLT